MLNRRKFIAATVASSAAFLTSGYGALAQQMPTVNDVLYDPTNPILGNPNGDVTVVEYFDYQCSYCKKSHAELMRVVNNDGNVRLVLKDWTIFGDVSVYASRLVLAAEKSGQYSKALEALMATSGKLSKDQVITALKKSGLDAAKLETSYRQDAARIDGLLQRTMDQGNAFNFGGTPSFVIGTKLYGGVMKEKDLIEAIKLARTS